MPEVKAPEQAPEQDAEQGNPAPEKAPASVLPLDQFISLEGAAADATVDIPAFSEGVSAIVAEVPNLKKAEDSHNRVRVLLAAAMIACRNAVTYKDHPDTFGASKLYRRLFGSWIVSTVLEAHPTMETVNPATGETVTVPTDRDWVKKELDYVRINYLGESATRAKGMLFESVIRDAATSGKIPGAEVKQDGTIVVPVLTRKKDADGKPIPKLEKDAEGNDVPVLSVYRPGQAINVPGFAKKAIQDVIATAPTKKDPEDPKKMVPTVNIPVRFGGAETEGGTGGNKSKGPEDYAKAFRGALETLTDASDGHLATLEMVQWFHAAATVLVDSLNRKDPAIVNPKDHAEVLLRVSKLLLAEAGMLNGNQGATLEKVDKLRYVPEGEKAPEKDAEKDPAPEQDADAEQDEDNS